MLLRLFTAITTAALLSACQNDPTSTAISAPEADLKLYVFDCGQLDLSDVSAFGLSNAQTDVRQLFVPCYLIEHPRGRLLFDLGLPAAIAGTGDVEYQPGAIMRYERSLESQLAELSLRPADIDLISYSHSHFDHVGSANQFAASQLLIQRTEHEAAFEHADQYEVFVPDLYEALRNSQRILLDGDHDVFGDGRVRLISAPGHTPGHQVLWLDLQNTGPLVLSGDLYHFEASRTHRTVPVFNTNKADSLKSMERVEQLINDTGATLWIEHNQALADTLRKAPAFYD